MTREDRETDIRDYVAYLDRVVEHVTPSRAQVRIRALGFSQGCATAFRWAALGATRVHDLILWAGEVPPDVVLVLVEQTEKDVHALPARGRPVPVLVHVHAPIGDAERVRHLVRLLGKQHRPVRARDREALALDGQPLPVYASKDNRREWIHAVDHCRAIAAVVDNGRIGETYHVPDEKRLPPEGTELWDGFLARSAPNTAPPRLARQLSRAWCKHG